MRRAAVIGCGDISIVHFEAIGALGEATLVAVCDLDPALAKLPGTAGAFPRTPIIGRCSSWSRSTSCTSAHRMINMPRWRSTATEPGLPC